MGLTIEAENALEQSAARAALSKKKKDPGYSLEISSIHRRVKEMMKSRSTAPEAEAAASKGPSYQPLQGPDSALPPGWEARMHESSGIWLCSRLQPVWCSFSRLFSQFLCSKTQSHALHIAVHAQCVHVAFCSGL